MRARARRRLAWAFASGALALLPHAARATITYQTYQLDITVRPDGTYTAQLHFERSTNSAAETTTIAQLPIAFTPSLETVEITEAATVKRDGSRHEVDRASIRDQLPPGSSTAPMFSDNQQKVVVFPDLAEGDTEVLTLRREVSHPLFPGQFVFGQTFTRTAIWHNARVSITTPQAVRLRTETIDLGMTRAEQSDTTRTEWRFDQPAPVGARFAVSPIDRQPRLYASSFADYDAMADAYTALSAPKETVTDAIRAKAEDITKGITDRREQARALYEWVSRNIRYVAIFLGRGGIEPHDASVVLANGYGDCKDHVVLLAALLKARGIESQGVLINLGNAYTISGPPTFTSLNHIITYLPEFDLYTDSTAGVAPFGILPFEERGKQAVITGGIKPALRAIPVLREDDNTTTSTTRADLSPDGKITGTTITEANGPAAVSLRAVALQIQRVSTRQVAERLLSTYGQTGSGDIELAGTHPEAPASPFQVRARFTLEDRPGILEGDGFALPTGLPMLARPGDYLLGPMAQTSLPETEPTPCFAGRQTEILILRLPEGRKPARLPQARHVTTEMFSYSAEWSFSDRTLTVRRGLESRINQPLCEGPLRHAAVEAQRTIRRDQQTTLALQTD